MEEFLPGISFKKNYVTKEKVALELSKLLKKIQDKNKPLQKGL
jgi:hypothetical protein